MRKINRVHFTITGEWLTWMLRHLWVEGSEVKAVNVWCGAFPKLSSEKIIKTHFLNVVSGRKKLVGNNEYDLVDDDKKYWSTYQDGEENTDFPLLQSWEDVILLKKVKLYFSEMDLRAVRLNRRFATTQKGNGNNSMRWEQAVEENKVENVYRKHVSDNWSEIRNLTMRLKMDLDLQILTAPDAPLPVTLTFNTKKAYFSKSQKINGNIDQCFNLQDEIEAILTPIRIYFETKYEGHIHINDTMNYSGLSQFNKWDVAAEEKRRGKESNISKLALEERDQENKSESLIEKVEKGKSLDVMAYVHNLLEDSKREDRFKPDHPENTKWTSGYIDREGRLYACADLQHINFADELCIHFGLKQKESDEDGQIILDNVGWIKISLLRFFWEETKKITDSQKETILKYMIAKKIKKTLFNSISSYNLKTFDEQFNSE
ncbi:MAG: hypothetical protein WCX82_03545 [archaeon]|jgi:hypothetical protein